jgi:hypothetical protein
MNQNRQIEKQLAKRFQLEDLRCGNQTIRNEKGLRENEIRIEYIWLIIFDRAFFEKGGILNIKYESSEFRGIENKEKLTKLIFTIDEQGKLESIFEEEETKNFSNLIPEFSKIDLFEANRGITLDGIFYQITLISNNIKTIIEVNNPNHKSWKNLEGKIWKMGIDLANKSNDDVLKNIFK